MHEQQMEATIQIPRLRLHPLHSRHPLLIFPALPPPAASLTIHGIEARDAVRHPDDGDQVHHHVAVEMEEEGLHLRRLTGQYRALHHGEDVDHPVLKRRGEAHRRHRERHQWRIQRGEE